MHRVTTVVLSMMVLSSGWVPVARGTTEEELQEWMRAQLNERLYDSCRIVKLKREEVEVYQGFAEFINGQRSALTVTVSDSGVTYKFGKPRPAGVEPNAVQLSRLEVIISRQKMEIARLEELCRQAGVEPQASETGAEGISVASASEHAGGRKVTAAAPGPTFTREMYEKIEKGMTGAQVSSILGGPGEPTSRSSFDGATCEVRVWMNPDDSHVCLVLREGAVLVKTQSGLSEPPSSPEPERQETGDLHQWQLARPTDGAPVAVGLSLGQWLKDVHDALTKTSGVPAQVDVVEESDGITVKLAYQDARQTAHRVELRLTCLPGEEAIPDAGAGTARRACVPVSIRTDEQEEAGPIQAWEAMTTLAARPSDQK